MFDKLFNFFGYVPSTLISNLGRVPIIPQKNTGDDYSASLIDGVNYTKRILSYNLYDSNLVFKGLCDRLIDLCLHSGLTLDCNIADSPDLNNRIENLWSYWCQNVKGVDKLERHKFSVIERRIMKEAMLGGDVLVVLHYIKGYPKIQIISGGQVCSPSNKGDKNIHYGVEYKNDVEVAYHVAERILKDSDKNIGDDKIKRVSAFTSEGRRRAWLVRWQDKRANEIRGRPISLRLNEILRQLEEYSEAELQSAKTNSKIALSIQRELGAKIVNPKSRFTGAMRRTTQEDLPAENNRNITLNKKELANGVVIEGLEPGEKLQAHDTSRTNLNFSNFYDAWVSIIARSEGIPPEILKLEFTNSYSASRAAFITMDENIKVRRDFFTSEFHNVYYSEWLLSLAKDNKIPELSEYIKAIDNDDWEVVGKFNNVKWQGYKRPAIDPLKQMKAVETAINLGVTTREKESNDYNGSDFDKNIKQLEAENKKWHFANKHLQNINNSVINDVEDQNLEGIDA